jgi:anti-sigma regulatory factor (Ser/Thr protein kinase)
MDRCKTPPFGLPVPSRENYFRHELHLPHSEAAVGLARDFIKGRLLKWARRDIIDDAALIITELVTNAFIHAPSPDYFTVIDWNGGMIRLEMWDSSPFRPQRLPIGLTGEHGRGIRLIEALSEEWGSVITASGKCVWATLPLIPKKIP